MPLIHRHELSDSTIRGEDQVASVCLIFDEREPGQGPRLHSHGYDETWVVQEGNISFQVGDNRLKAGPGDVAIIPQAHRTGSSTTAPVDQESSVSTPAQRSSANGLSNPVTEPLLRHS